MQTRKLLALAKVEAVVPPGILLAVSDEVLTAAVSSPRSLPPFANVPVAFILLFKMTPLCQSSSYCLIQLMAVILFDGLRLLLYPDHLLTGSAPTSTVCEGTGTRLPISPTSACSSDKSRFERYFQAFLHNYRMKTF